MSGFKSVSATFWCCVVLLLACRSASAQTWESSLYGAGWSPTPALSFATDKVIQDFSYAGYRRGEVPLPANPPGATFNVVSGYGADPTGTSDSTVAIQAAINAAATAGGGIVYLPAGTYQVSPQGSATYALNITAGNIVLRGAGTGQTFLVNTSTSMRNKVIIDVTGPGSASWTSVQSPSTTITADLMGPTTRIPVTSTSGFSVGEFIIIRADPGDDWANEHNEDGWVGYANSYGRFLYHRQIKAVDAANNIIEVDIPTRYYLKTRDNARVYRKTTLIAEVGVEQLSIGNVQHSGTGWAEEDYNSPANGSYDTHASYVLRFTRVRDGWIRNVNTFQPAGNTTTCHLLSNGILLSECSRITVKDCHLQRPQFGGGGGNGYMYRLQNSSDSLLDNCTAEFSRHGMVFSHMATSGNVIYRCLDKNTGKQTGDTGNQNTSGRGSDHHMHFSHSNLIDTSVADNSYFEARYRPFGSAPLHNLTSAHGVYWNTEGKASAQSYLIHSQQSRYGYVIGTRGGVTTVKTDGTSTTKTAPIDHVEGVGQGDTLTPFSLYEDQRRRRLKLPRIQGQAPWQLGFPTNSLTLAPVVSFGDEAGVPEGAQFVWSQLAGPGAAVFTSPQSAASTVAFPQPGTYELQLMAGITGLMIDGFAAKASITVEVSTAPQLQFELIAVADAYVHGDAPDNNYGTGTSLWLKNVTGSNFDRESYLRFDLTPLQGLEVVSATLVMQRTQPNSDAQIITYLVSNDAWTETGLTWNNKPAVGSQIAAWALATELQDVVDLTPAVAAEAAGDGMMSIANVVASQVTSATIYQHASREHGTVAWRPRLLVTCRQTVPDFAAWVSTASGLSGAQLLPGADPDGDGRTNLEEFILNTLPNSPDSGRVMQLDAANRRLKLTVNEHLPAGVLLAVEYTDGLSGSGWQLWPGIQWLSLNEPGVGRHLEADLSPAMEGQPLRFFRLRYSLQE